MIRSALRRFGIGIVGVLGLLLPAQGPGQELPVDSAAVRALVEEATEAIRSAPPRERNGARLLARLSRAREAWGLEPMEPIDLPPQPHEELRRVAEEEGALELAHRILEADSAGPAQWHYAGLISLLVREREDELAVRVARHLRTAPSATSWIMSDGGGSPEARIARIEALVASGAIRDDEEPEVTGQILAEEARADFHGAWARTDTVPDLTRRVTLRMAVLPRAWQLGPPERGRLFREVYEEARAVPDSARREGYLDRLGWLCHRPGFEGCQELEIPLPDPPEASHHRAAIHNAVREGAFPEARRRHDSLSVHLDEGRAALTVLRATADALQPGSPEIEGWAREWSERGLALASSVEPPLPDSLLAFVVPLLALRDPERALEIGDGIRDPGLRGEAHGRMAQLLVRVDVLSAWEATLRGRADYRARDSAALLYPVLRSLGRDAEAAEALAIAHPWRVPGILMLWARTELSAGRRSAARETARAARDLIGQGEPAALSFLEWGALHALGLLDETLEWARELEDPELRGRVLVELIHGLTSAHLLWPHHRESIQIHGPPEGPGLAPGSIGTRSRPTGLDREPPYLPAASIGSSRARTTLVTP